MVSPSFEQFRDLVLADEAMQKELRSLSDRKEFVARIVELGRVNGFEFTKADIEDEMRRGSRVWSE